MYVLPPARRALAVDDFLEETTFSAEKQPDPAVPALEADGGRA
jgi:hypothetical protein